MIRALQTFTQADIWPIVTGYETREIYAVEKTETDEKTVFDICLVHLERTYQSAFFQDFTPEECQWHLSYLPQGYSFGAYQDDRLIGFALAEAIPHDKMLFVRELHVMVGFRRMGIGRALMEQVIAKARQASLVMIMVETQNTNVKAIRFYRKMGFTLELIDMAPPHYENLGGEEVRQIAFYMKLTL